MEITFEAVRDVIVNTLSCSPEEITPETRLQEDLGADSLEAVEISMALEESLGLGIADEDIEGIKTVGDILRYLQNKAQA